MHWRMPWLALKMFLFLLSLSKIFLTSTIVHSDAVAFVKHCSLVVIFSLCVLELTSLNAYLSCRAVNVMLVFTSYVGRRCGLRCRDKMTVVLKSSVDWVSHCWSLTEVCSRSCCAHRVLKSKLAELLNDSTSLHQFHEGIVQVWSRQSWFWCEDFGLIYITDVGNFSLSLGCLLSWTPVGHTFNWLNCQVL